MASTHREIESEGAHVFSESGPPDEQTTQTEMSQLNTSIEESYPKSLTMYLLSLVHIRRQ